ncbi:MAG: uracil-DNA glycosylase [Chloroflexi bacterium]|nr:uracil-DNA glycosylase [Chloroflexota bacterium]
MPEIDTFPRYLRAGDEPAERFTALVAAAHACGRCPRMAGRTRVIGPACGPLDPTVLFVAEAPGRHGADRTGIPLSADRSGRTFEEALARAGLARSDVFVTNAVLCNPRRPDGRNDRPSASELRNCSTYLRATIDLLDPPWVVTLGRVALDALRSIEAHHLVLKQGLGTVHPWYGRHLVPLYHPGPRSLIQRGHERYFADFARLGALVRGDALGSAGP